MTNTPWADGMNRESQMEVEPGMRFSREVHRAFRCPCARVRVSGAGAGGGVAREGLEGDLEAEEASVWRENGVPAKDLRG